MNKTGGDDGWWTIGPRTATGESLDISAAGNFGNLSYGMEPRVNYLKNKARGDDG